MELTGETVTLIKYLGDLSFIQLAQLRHRGAFSTVAQTFADFCRFCASCESASVQVLPGIWAKVRLIEA